MAQPFGDVPDTTRLVRTPAPERPELGRLVAAAQCHRMTEAEIAAQRRSWAIGETMLDHPEMSRAEAAAIVDREASHG